MIENNTPTIETKRCILRKFTLDDVDDFYELMSNERVNKYIPLLPFKSKDEAKEFLIKSHIEKYNNVSSYRYAVCVKDINKVIGYVGLSQSECNDFGYAIHEDYWHQGYASEVCEAVLKQLKQDGIEYITATHDVNNPNSGKVMKKLGMQYKYSYHEIWQPKNFMVTFRMYQLNFIDNDFTYMGYWNKYDHLIEDVE
ncbi:GNAT family N-acetyltransferase [Anaerorhabdus furcosa]|uniref:Protein N-acetyltransferase, RimJ/RimL family n=1 Tax=Anaerorhabdus furcosa TaxID=118967 RepID=A0A1T4MRG7_9FIRM|nr:GNAT family N-acetyltransferase [Anaerorhabdus furcosa]SJZ69602.1 Protein N-acetyltransferase, RimJ/RimL family [Anaerorhabdus furcosa]